MDLRGAHQSQLQKSLGDLKLFLDIHSYASYVISNWWFFHPADWHREWECRRPKRPASEGGGACPAPLVMPATAGTPLPGQKRDSPPRPAREGCGGNDEVMGIA